MNFNLLIPITIVLCFGFAQREYYAPQSMSYQGYLADALGSPVNGTVQVNIFVYENEEPQGGGEPYLFQYGPADLNVTNGYFSVLLSQGITELFTGVYEALYIQVVINEEVLSPRQLITSVPSAISSFNFQNWTIDHPVTFEGYLQCTDINVSGEMTATFGNFEEDVNLNDDLMMYGGGVFGMYEQIDEWTFRPRIIMESHDFGYIELKNEENQQTIELDGETGIITCGSINPGRIQLRNSNGDVTFEIDPETGNIFYSGELIRR